MPSVSLPAVIQTLSQEWIPDRTGTILAYGNAVGIYHRDNMKTDFPKSVFACLFLCSVQMIPGQIQKNGRICIFPSVNGGMYENMDRTIRISKGKFRDHPAVGGPPEKMQDDLAGEFSFQVFQTV